MATNLFGPLKTVVDNLILEFNKLRADVVALRTAYEAHIHTGVTVGAADSAIRKAATAGVAPAITSTTLTNTP